MPVLLAARASLDDGRIGLVDQHPRQRLAVELDAPGPVGRGHDIDVGNRRRADRVAEGAAGLRLEAPNFGDHVGEVLVVDAADLAQQGKIAPRQRRQVGDHRLHGRIEAVALAQLQREALGEVAREHARRLERVHLDEHGLDGVRGSFPGVRRFRPAQPIK